MFGLNSNNTQHKRVKLKNILHLKVDNDKDRDNDSNNMSSKNNYNKKKRPMSATRFTLFKNNNISVHNISNGKRTLLVLNDLLEIYEIKTLNDMNENKLSIGKYITLGKNDKVLRPLFSKVTMNRGSGNVVNISWHNTSNDVWELQFEDNIICDHFCNTMIQSEDKEISLLDELLSDDDEDENINTNINRHDNYCDDDDDDKTLAHSNDSIDLLQLFKDAVSNMNSFKFENKPVPQRSTSIPSNFYKRLSLINIQPESVQTQSEYRVSSENKYKRFSTMDYSTISKDSLPGTRINSTASTISVKKTILE
ncbi:hypothetical protein HANVADRAFT_58639 [Hanseniaspora valbyensis NRRL Y-1626]|uniref:Inheritance of peroxisomes protein 1 n=1 Tax=Hanseniaspora valbyensis NRRL Y-1626 TaxID=766949 RepID=A0A1B7TG46_9ASCO|nr:hypothetical protein HANVADRAFT_58639 [Hanseniaspora valbyensis NRRL Y-1626]